MIWEELISDEALEDDQAGVLDVSPNSAFTELGEGGGSTQN